MLRGLNGSCHMVTRYRPAGIAPIRNTPFSLVTVMYGLSCMYIHLSMWGCVSQSKRTGPG